MDYHNEDATTLSFCINTVTDSLHTFQLCWQMDPKCVTLETTSQKLRYHYQRKNEEILPLLKKKNNNHIYFFQKDSYSKASNRHRWDERHILLTQPQPKQFPQQPGGPAYLHSVSALSARQQLAEWPYKWSISHRCYSC